MRILLSSLACVVVLLLSGCSTPSTPADNPDVGSETDSTSDDSIGGGPSPTTTTTTTTSQPATTSSSPATVTKRAVIAHQVFTGMLPDPDSGPDALFPSFTIDVPAGGDQVMFFYNTTYSGFWQSVVTITDPDGVSYDNLAADDCGIVFPAPPGVNQAYSCWILDLRGEVPAGTYTIEMTWQVGEATENFSLDFTAWGMVPA